MQEPKSELTREAFNKALLDNFPQGAEFGWFKREDVFVFWKNLMKPQPLDGNLLIIKTNDDMCPNCVTPWKCNGPHIEVRL